MRRLIGAALSLTLALAACGGGGAGDEPARDAAPKAAKFGVSVASYEPVADRPQRFIAGLTAGQGRLVSFGTVEFAFFYAGSKDKPVDPPRPGPTVKASFLPIPGQPEAPADAEPRLVTPSEGVGVYGARNVTFPEAGFWEVEVTASIDGAESTAKGAFEVFAEPQLPFQGQPAPRTRNHVWGAPDVPVKAIDSRAEEGGDDPAPGLHDAVIADVIAAGKPMLVVVATPVFCQSRFCGPITDMAEELDSRYGDRMEFVHLEVYRDFDRNAVNAAAAEWAYVEEKKELTEPWTYLVGSDGVIVDRWDNVASEAEVAAAIEALLTP